MKGADQVDLKIAGEIGGKQYPSTTVAGKQGNVNFETYRIELATSPLGSKLVPTVFTPYLLSFPPQEVKVGWRQIAGEAVFEIVGDCTFAGVKGLQGRISVESQKTVDDFCVSQQFPLAIMAGQKVAGTLTGEVKLIEYRPGR